MIIFSQDKKQIINFDNIRIVEINNPTTWQQGFYSIDTYPECEDQQEWHIRLGKYATEERAKEVLQEILTTYSNFETLRHSDEREKNTLKEILQNRYKYFDLYEMPQK